jgi:hypothetical protein
MTNGHVSDKTFQWFTLDPVFDTHIYSNTNFFRRMWFIGNLFGTTRMDKKTVWIGIIDFNNCIRGEENNWQTEIHVAISKEKLLNVLKERIQDRDNADVDKDAIIESLDKAWFADKDDFELARFNYHIYEKELIE